MRGGWRPNITAIYWPPTLMAVSVVFFSFSRTAQMEAQGPTLLAFSTTSYQQLLWTPTLLTSNSIGGPEGPFRLVWLFLPHLVSNSNYNCLTSVLTELYNSSTSTQSPTQSLEWHVWSSSSRNNCHAVHRLLSSGASLWSGTFTLSHIISRAHLRHFLS